MRGRVHAVTESAATVVDNVAAGRFELLVDGEAAGFAEYRLTGRAVAFTHTVIESDFEGRGLGSVLARAALEASRQAGREVRPYCPFIRRYIQRHPTYIELVAAGHRAEFGLPIASEPGGG
jgi:predicted GNAT family acetyltransferase